MRDRWDRFAAREPYFAVLTESRFLRANFDDAAEEEFFASGEGHVAELYATLVQTFSPQLRAVDVLEYGCGPGRLLLPFAQRAERVTGVDISPAMLEVARRHVERAGATNVDLLTDGELAGDDRTFDLVNCFLLMQRLTRSTGIELQRQLVRRVRVGGALVLHIPYRSRASRTLAIGRFLRRHLPGLNAAANLVRRKPAATPLFANTTYDVNDVLALLQASGFTEPHMTFTTQGELDGVIIHARRVTRAAVETAPAEARTVTIEVPPPTASEREPDFIDVRRMIADTPIERLNELAESYFASLDTWDHHLAKPFARAEDTPQLLINAGNLLQGLSLGPGMTVLEFGAGTGWLSRFLTQLGCRVILLDVSPTALEIARELYRRHPVIGEQPEPEFVVFDGTRIDLPDASVDRIVCFDAFHHSTQPHETLREFARVLRAGGIAGFAEPGPKHSRTPQSQYEMRTYGVVENDVDVHALWQTAVRLGFVEIRLAAHNVPPFHVTLDEFDDLLAGGNTLARWMEASRAFLQDVRTFFLTKAGKTTPDSRRTEGLACSIHARLLSETTAAGQPIPIAAVVRNIGSAPWRPSGDEIGAVALGAHLYRADGRLLRFDLAWTDIPRALAPGEESTFDFELPPLDPGSYIVELDCVAQKVAWFAQLGSKTAQLRITIT